MAVDDANRDTAERGDFDPRYDPAFQRGYQPKPGERPRTRVRDAGASATASAAATGQNAPAAPTPFERPGQRGAERPAPATAGAAAATVADPAPVWPPIPPSSQRAATSPAFSAAAAPAPASPVTEAPASRAVVAPDSWEIEVERERADAELAAYGPATPDVLPVRRGGILETTDFSPRRNRAVLTLWLVGAGLVALGILLYVMSVFTSYTNPTSGADVTGLVFSQLGWMLAGPLITVGLATLVVLLGLTLLSSRRPPASIESEEDPATRRPVV
ncbi:hypothetical protein GCM10027406_37090 [Leifsonia lichenia]